MLSVSFKLDLALLKALEILRGGNALIRALIVIVSDEVMRLHGNPIEVTESLDDDLAKIRDYLKDNNIDAAFIILNIGNDKFAQISLCLECVKPKIKMLYASGASHLAESTELKNLGRAQLIQIGDLTASFFEKMTESSEDLMTEKEKLRAAMDKLELAPMPVALPGVTMPLTDDGMMLLKRFGSGELSAVTFAVSVENISAEKSIDTVEAPSSFIIDAVKELIPSNQPRFVALRCPAGSATMKTLMVYVCPGACKPREKMLYASSKSSFLSQAKHYGISFERRLEVDSVSELGTAVMDALEAEEGDECFEQPLPPRPAPVKGPRMLI